MKIAFGGMAGFLFTGGKNLSAPENGTPKDHASYEIDKKTVQAASGFKHSTLASDNTDGVGLQLVCFFDISGSIDEAEYDLQLEAMAEAIESDEFKNAVFYPGGPQSIAICIADFSRLTGLPVPWLDIRKGDDHKFKLLADEIRKIPRRAQGGTIQIRALEFAAKLIENCPWSGDRTVVDIMTDGKDNSYGPYESGPKGLGTVHLRKLRRELAKKHNATINALITLDPKQPDLESWAKKNLITQIDDILATNTRIDPGFLKIVATQRTDNEAVRAYQNRTKNAFHRKLILEVGQIDIDDLRELRKVQGRANKLRRFHPGMN